ncbi:MAG: hypothetical protein IT428_00370 [Planctomycetaceae bacterium]|nr:hypothetical protein [Planctomycetaceae bacterium]
MALRLSHRHQDEELEAHSPTTDQSPPIVSVHPFPGVDAHPIPPVSELEVDQLDDEIEWRMIFVGWSPAALAIEPPTPLKAIARHFERLDEYLGLETFDISAWEPSEKERDRLSYFLEHRDAEHFREGVRDSLYESTGMLMDVGKPRPQPITAPLDVATTLARLCHPAANSAAGRPTAEEQQRTWNDWLRLLDEQVIRPLKDDALLIPDPRERVLRLALADVSHAFHLRAAQLNQRLSRSTVDRSAENSEPMALKSFDKLLATVDRVVDLSREIDRCGQATQVRTIPASVLPLKRLRGSPDCG